VQNEKSPPDASASSAAHYKQHRVRWVLLALLAYLTRLFAIKHEETGGGSGPIESQTNPNQATGTAPGTTHQSATSQSTPSAGAGGGIRKTDDGRAADAVPERNGPSARVHRFFERNAGWFTLLATAVLAVALLLATSIADSAILNTKYAPYISQITVVAVGVFLLFVILLFTRPLNTQSDINTIFRFGWYFVVVVGIFGLLFLIIGVDGIGGDDLWTTGRIGPSEATVAASSVSEPPPEHEVEGDGTIAMPSGGTSDHRRAIGPASDETADGRGGSAPAPLARGSVREGFEGAVPPDAKPDVRGGADPAVEKTGDHSGSKAALRRPMARSHFLLTVVLGCDYNSVVYRNPRGLRTASTADSTSKTAPGSTSTAATGSNAAAADVLASMDTHAAQSGMPEGVNCGELPPQWVIVLGGSILNCDFDSTCPKDLPRPNIAAREAEYQRAQERLKDARKRRGSSHEALDSLQMLRASNISIGAADLHQLQERIADLPHVDSFEGEVRDAKEKLAEARRLNGFGLNIEGSPVIGGVVVPVFFVAIALMGALVNMARKLPEFQERVEPKYREEFESKLATSGDVQTPISWEYARDLVVFQIIQVLSAAGIAVLAYSWARPQDQATTVIIAFAAGFSSEVFLLAVRGVVDRMIGLGPRPPRVRAMLMSDTKDDQKGDIPPRGPADTAPKTASGFKVGDLVRLLQPVGPCMPGAEGIVLSVASDGELIVRTTRDHTGAPLNVRLQSQSASAFQLVGAPRTNTTVGGGRGDAPAGQAGGESAVGPVG
jgi:hypothetical protein